MEQESGIEQPPAKEAGVNYLRNKEAQILLALVKIIDWQRTQEYETVLTRVSQETKAA